MYVLRMRIIQYICEISIERECAFAQLYVMYGNVYAYASFTINKKKTHFIDHCLECVCFAYWYACIKT